MPPLFAAGDRFDPVIARLRGLVEDGQLPFASIRIARRGTMLAEAHLSGSESIGPDSLYRIYSMTKPVVAAATVLLVEDGRLALEDPVAKYVPEFADLKVAAGALDALEPARPMTVAHLLTHSCGLVNSWGDARVAPLYREAGLVAAAWMYDPAVGGLEGFARRLSALPLEFQPGSDWVYGCGLDIAGLVIERISGQCLGAFLKRRIFDPLGMADTGFFVPEEHAGRLAGLYNARDGGIVRVADGSERSPLKRPFADAGSAGLVSTLEDYGRFADMLANGGARGDVRVMSGASARLLMTPHGAQEALLPALQRFGSYAPGSVGQALGGITRLDDRSGPGSAGEYAWGGAAGTGFWATPGPGLSVTLMTQLMPAAAVPARDVLRPLIYAAL
ncbi:beta-lactamase family protein [Flavobacterium sp. MXW15]|uniref:Beta-lactamase family protein n=1 Tax=Xanthomonas chitinilytica TaxID=2989819 RepID=A0ABT3JX69_9XANT|nr:serine hydrolase domain-containing protein [Xanthomonas sp. H13-6]MCW4455254.1 beta-lactamase family protein [Flavobacterium sp. MXW15]MCW4473081.1 beta-lactamase family protein [Xanthomonas sp. H13-6]